NAISVSCQKQEQTYRELITDPVMFTSEYNQVISHSALPVVKDELSITLKIKVLSHGSSWYNGSQPYTLKPSDSAPYLGLSITGNSDTGISMDGYGFLLNRCLQNIQLQSIIFNDGPLYIGKHLNRDGFTGEI
ncbi:29277_t:CDS:2, partial [Racocetra persica]